MGSLPHPPLPPLPPLYRSLNASLNMFNKWALGIYGFRFPFLLTSSEFTNFMTGRPTPLPLLLEIPRVFQAARPHRSDIRVGWLHPCRPHGIQLRHVGTCGDARVLGEPPPHAEEAMERCNSWAVCIASACCKLEPCTAQVAQYSAPCRCSVHWYLYGAQHCSQQHFPPGHLAVAEPNYQV